MARSTEAVAKADRVETVLDLLRARGGRITTSRRLLLSRLFESSSHRTAEELATEVQALAPDVHLSTIYRSLDELQRLGVIVHTHLGHGATMYTLASHAHSHFICEKCGVMIEAPDDFFKGLARSAKTKLGFSIDPHHFAILGCCSACSPQ